MLQLVRLAERVNRNFDETLALALAPALFSWMWLKPSTSYGSKVSFAS
jgi:hypothetical protein